MCLHGSTVSPSPSTRGMAENRLPTIGRVWQRPSSAYQSTVGRHLTVPLEHPSEGGAPADDMVPFRTALSSLLGDR
jgi:hypothetical protein